MVQGGGAVTLDGDYKKDRIEISKFEGCQAQQGGSLLNSADTKTDDFSRSFFNSNKDIQTSKIQIFESIKSAGAKIFGLTVGKIISQMKSKSKSVIQEEVLQILRDYQGISSNLGPFSVKLKPIKANFPRILDVLRGTDPKKDSVFLQNLKSLIQETETIDELEELAKKQQEGKPFEINRMNNFIESLKNQKKLDDCMVILRDSLSLMLTLKPNFDEYEKFLGEAAQTVVEVLKDSGTIGEKNSLLQQLKYMVDGQSGKKYMVDGQIGKKAILKAIKQAAVKVDDYETVTFIEQKFK